MDNKTIILLAAAGLGAYYLMNQQENEQTAYFPPGSGGGYNPSTPQPPVSAGDKIVRTVEAGKTVVDAGKAIVTAVSSIFKKKEKPSNNVNFIPPMTVSSVPGHYA